MINKMELSNMAQFRRSWEKMNLLQLMFSTVQKIENLTLIFFPMGKHKWVCYKEINQCNCN